MTAPESISASAPTIGRIRSLTSLRIFAAVGVVWYHANMVVNGFTRHAQGNDLDKSLLEGRIGVAFFFVLSGFILTYIYAHTMKTMNARNVLIYLVNRIARIYPMHLLVLAVVVTMSLVSFTTYGNTLISFVGVVNSVPNTGDLPHRIIEIVSNATLTQGLIPYGFEVFGYNSVSWSLSAEMFFYVLFPFMVFLVLRLFRWNGYILALLCLLVIGIQQLRMSTITHEVIIIERLYSYPPMRLVEFVFGIAAGLIFLQRYKQEERTKLPLAGTAFELGALLLVVASIWTMANHIPYEYRQAGLYSIPMTIFILVFAFERGLITRALSIRPLEYLGELSFGVYLWHMPVMLYLHHHRQYTRLEIGTLSLSIALVLACITYHFYELPMRTKVRNAGTRWVKSRIS